MRVDGCDPRPPADRHLGRGQDVEAEAAIPAGTYHSTRNGRGPHAWRDHWLWVPVHGRDGAVEAVLSVDDPIDRCLPSRDRLQALRLFANQAATTLEAAARFAEMQLNARAAQGPTPPGGAHYHGRRTRGGRSLDVNVDVTDERRSAGEAGINLDLNDEQLAVQGTVREFVDRRIMPVAHENDVNHHLDMGVIEEMGELGLLGAPIPPEYGGGGLDYVSEALICEEIERGESAFRTLLSVHVGLNSLSLLRYGSEDQKQRYLVPMARGEKLGCFALTEPAAGSDVAAMQSTAARRPDGGYLLNGQKNWISYATEADYALVFAKTDRDAGHRGISAFMVERAWKGVEARRIEHKLGVWAGSTGELFFSDVEVPEENRIGEEGDGFRVAMHSLDQGRFTVASGALGVIRGCLEASVKYANERRTFGKRIGEHQFVQDMIAEMVLGYETSRLLVLQAAHAKNQGRRNTRETSLAKWHATESAFRAAHLAVQVHGAYGYSAEYPVERYFRNARAPIIYEGTTQIHKMMQAEHALGYRRLNG